MEHTPACTYTYHMYVHTPVCIWNDWASERWSNHVSCVGHKYDIAGVLVAVGHRAGGGRVTAGLWALLQWRKTGILSWQGFLPPCKDRLIRKAVAWHYQQDEHIFGLRFQHGPFTGGSQPAALTRLQFLVLPVSPTVSAKHVAKRIVRGFLFLSLAPITKGTSETGSWYLKSKPLLHQGYGLALEINGEKLQLGLGCPQKPPEMWYGTEMHTLHRAQQVSKSLLGRVEWITWLIGGKFLKNSV